jgi:uncharacterized protein YbjT (DUF2867 family)
MILITGASGTVGRAVLQEVRKTGKPFTILRPNGFMQNIVAFHAPSIRAGSVLRFDG